MPDDIKTEDHSIKLKEIIKTSLSDHFKTPKEPYPSETLINKVHSEL